MCATMYQSPLTFTSLPSKETVGNELISGLLRDHFDPLLKKYHEDLVGRLLSLESSLHSLAGNINESKHLSNSHMLPSSFANPVAFTSESSSKNGLQQRMRGTTPSPPAMEVCQTDSLFLNAMAEEVEHAREAEKENAEYLIQHEIKSKARRESSHTMGSMSGEAELTPLQNLVTCGRFDMVVISLIVSNGLFIGFQAQYFATTAAVAMPVGVQLLSWGYCLFFFCELMLRMFAFRCEFFYKRSWGWNNADFVIVSLSIFEVMLLNFGGQDGGGQLSLIRLVRVVRIVRIFRIIKMFDFFRELRVLVLAIAGAVKSLMWALCLLCFIMYVVAVIITFGAAEAAKDDDLLDKYWSSLLKSMYTLWMSITGGISWIEVVEPLSSLGFGYPLVFNAYIGFVQIAVLNVVTGVFCENAMASAAQDETEVLLEHVKRKAEYVKKLTSIFSDVGDEISVKDFESKLELKSMRVYFETLDINVDNARTLFRLLDQDGSGLVTIEEFVSGCLHLRGFAKSVDVAEILQKVDVLHTATTKLAAQDSAVGHNVAQLGGIVLALRADVHAIAAGKAGPGECMPSSSERAGTQTPTNPPEGNPDTQRSLQYRIRTPRSVTPDVVD